MTQDKILLDEPVRYLCAKSRCRSYRMIMNPTRETIVQDGDTLRQVRHVTSADVIQFENYEFVTRDPEVVKFLDNSPALTGKTRMGHVAKICIERCAPPDKVQEEFLQLVQEYGRENVISILKGQKPATLQQPGPDDEDEEESAPGPDDDGEDDELEEAAKAKLLKARKRLKKAIKTENELDIKKAKKAVAIAEKAVAAVPVKKKSRGG